MSTVQDPDARRKIVQKIRKCMALSASSNPHEAEAALRQARKLMEAYNVTQVDIDAALATEAEAKSSAKAHPPRWEAFLANKVADAFACSMLHSTMRMGRHSVSGSWKFIGLGASPEVAQYTFTVLLRQVRKARKEFSETRLSRFKRANQIKHADLFCEGWVGAVTHTIKAFAGSQETASAINAYIKLQYQEPGIMKARARTKTRVLDEKESCSLMLGHMAAENVTLNRGITPSGAPARALSEPRKALPAPNPEQASLF